ncbi:hypothetical protein GCM10010104_46220 [Streptomyces indiaensis]|uniref:Uncharacterized protein n=1 Tax=Streptomyces indiaensis TaxID=284033 RepID=A0ABN3DZS5_9ACTN
MGPTVRRPLVCAAGKCGVAPAELVPPGMWITAEGRVGSEAYRAPGGNRTGVCSKDRPDVTGRAVAYVEGIAWKPTLVAPGVYQLPS